MRLVCSAFCLISALSLHARVPLHGFAPDANLRMCGKSDERFAFVPRRFSLSWMLKRRENQRKNERNRTVHFVFPSYYVYLLHLLFSGRSLISRSSFLLHHRFFSLVCCCFFFIRSADVFTEHTLVKLAWFARGSNVSRCINAACVQLFGIHWFCYTIFFVCLHICWPLCSEREWNCRRRRSVKKKLFVSGRSMDQWMNGILFRVDLFEWFECTEHTARDNGIDRKTLSGNEKPVPDNAGRGIDLSFNFQWSCDKFFTKTHIRNGWSGAAIVCVRLRQSSAALRLRTFSGVPFRASFVTRQDNGHRNWIGMQHTVGVPWLVKEKLIYLDYFQLVFIVFHCLVLQRFQKPALIPLHCNFGSKQFPNTNKRPMFRHFWLCHSTQNETTCCHSPGSHSGCTHFNAKLFVCVALKLHYNFKRDIVAFSAKSSLLSKRPAAARIVA